MKIIACVVCKDYRCFDKLGDTTILERVLCNLARTRGIERTILFADHRYFAKVADVARRIDHEAFEVPWQTTTNPEKMRAWLKTECQLEPEFIVLAEAIYPFLSAEKMEEALAHAQQKKTTTYVGRLFPSATVPLPHFQIAAVDKASEVTISNYHTISVSLIEALDMRKQDEYGIADALIRTDYFKQGKK